MKKGKGNFKIDDDFIKSYYDVAHYIRLNNLNKGCLFDLNDLLLENDYELYTSKKYSLSPRLSCIKVESDWLMKLNEIPDFESDNHFVKLKHSDDLVIDI